MTIYADLRDGTAGRLIAEKGTTGLLRETTAGGVYDPATGDLSAATTTDTSFSYVDLPMTHNRLRATFKEDLIEQINKVLLVSMKELAAASKQIDVDSILVLAGVVYRVVGFAPVAPDGTPIILKVGVTRA